MIAACPKCGMLGGLNITHACMTAGVPSHVPPPAPKQWQTCPVCLGRGTKDASFYDPEPRPRITDQVPCRSCGGRGIV